MSELISAVIKLRSGSPLFMGADMIFGEVDRDYAETRQKIAANEMSLDINHFERVV
jgi:hypothetical protein